MFLVHTVRVRGELACFTRPEFKAERFSYEVITPSAARGIFEAILWKPAIRWHIRRIYLLAPPRFIQLKRNEVATRASVQKYADSRQAWRAVGPSALDSVVAFLDSDEQRQRAVEHICQSGYESNDLFAFQVGDSFVQDLPKVKSYYSGTRQGVGSNQTQCLICGELRAPVDKHPGVKIPGGTTSGVALVSFNSDAFESYGLKRNANATVCRNCADAYTTSLNRLLSTKYPDPRNPGETLPRRFARPSSDTTAVFWASAKPSQIDLFANLFEDPRPESVEALLKSPQTDAPLVTDPNRFYCLILSGGQGRATVRGMHTGTVAEAETNLKRYFSSTQIVGAHRLIPLWLLLKALVPGRKLENLPPSLRSEIFLAILFGGKYPHTLLARAIERCRAEQEVTTQRAALPRTYLINNDNLEIKYVTRQNKYQPRLSPRALDGRSGAHPGGRTGKPEHNHCRPLLRRCQYKAHGCLSTIGWSRSTSPE